MTRWLAMLLMSVLALPALANPNVAIASAFADCKTISPTDAPHVRYLYCGHLAAADRQWYWEVASGHLNHLSLETLLKPPSVILDDGREMVYPGADDPLFKIKTDLFFRAIPRAMHFKFSLLSYRFSRVTWDKLAVQDHHLHVQAIAANDYWPGSAEYKAGWYPNKDGKEVSALTEDVDRGAYLGLVALTQSVCPVLYVDNFIWQTAISAKRTVGYYGLQGIKDRATFDKIVGFDRKLSEDYARPVLAVISDSGVTQQPRRVEGAEKLGGKKWTTFDSDEATKDSNPLRVLNGGFKHQAEEAIAGGGNGLMKYLLNNAAGARQDSAPDGIAGNRKSRSNDLRVHVYLACNECHVKNGLQDLDCYARNLFLNSPIPLKGVDPFVLVKLEQGYFRRLEPLLDSDRKRHGDALLECTGLTHAQYGVKLQDAYYAYDGPVSLERAAREMGCTPERLQEALERYLERQPTKTLDSAISVFRLPQARRRPLPLTTWREEIVVARAALLLGGAK